MKTFTLNAQKTLIALEEWMQYLEPWIISEDTPIYREYLIVFGLYDEASQFPLSLLPFWDNKGHLQAAATWQGQEKPSALVINFFASAPWNRWGQDERKIAGAGRVLLYLLVRASLSRGYNGVLVTTPSPDALGFYKKHKFVKGKGDKVVLTAKAAQELLKEFSHGT